MRGRISWLVAATTSAVVISFVVPLCLLVRTMAEDRAMAAADQEARNVAILVSIFDNDPRLSEWVQATDARGVARTTLLLESGNALGSPAPAMAHDPDVIRARNGQAYSGIDAEGGKILLPVVLADGTEVVQAVVTPDELHRGVGAAWLSIIGLGAVLLILALFIAARLGRRISEPLREVATVANRLREGDLGARARPTGPPETQELARALNDLAERIRELLAAERATVGELAHRLRTPVTALRLDSEAVAETDIADRLQEHIEVLQRDIDAIVGEARRPVREDMSGGCDAVAVIGDRLDFWSVLAEDQRRDLRVHLPSAPLNVPVPETDLRDLVDILVDNVFAHTREGVSFTVTLQKADGTARLVVSDAGGAVLPAVRRHGSTGLGLVIARRTAEGAGGELHFGREEGGGVRVEVSIPLLD